MSEYLGRLDPRLGLVEGEKRTAPVLVTSVQEQENALLLDRLFDDIVPTLEEAFPDDCREIYALAVLRALAPTPLHLASDRWDKILDVRELKPRLDRAGQSALFRRLSLQGEELVYDLSCFFSRSDEVMMAEKGHNRCHVHLPQINLALLCSAEHGLPTMVRALPGVRDVATICASLEEVGLEGKVLIMDRGFWGEEVLQLLEHRHLSYVIPTRRNSALYDRVIMSEDEFLYHDRLIHHGKASDGGRWLYRFEDDQMRVDEERNLAKMVQDGKLSKEKKTEKKVRMGHILIVSDLDRPPEAVYLLYKRRDKVERQFEVWKTTLQADRTWLRDDASMFGHVFVPFLSLYILARLEQSLRTAGLLSKYSSRHILNEFSKAYLIKSGDQVLEYEIPKKVRGLDRELGFDLFPKLRS
ncbi:MAG: transposase [Methanomassiliicoccales archaeon]|nr:transposase [Methanomassiliicoccales archaeon]